jgi:Na+:H+ antiporter, NhaA family
MPDRRSPKRVAEQLLLRPFQSFFRMEASSGLLLLGAALAALAWANSPLAEGYFALWGTQVTFAASGFEISKPLLLWINDGLMAIFFFVVGLEIKREVMTGELAEPKKAALSVAAAVGGMLVPAGLYYLVHSRLGGDAAGAAGWGVPMATDIAFALGVLALLGSRVPLALKVFVTAVAIVDDLGAVLVIAVFYTEKLSVGSLALAGAFLGACVLLNVGGVRKTWPYALLGLGLWVAFLKSGVHATIAGVLLALTIPANRLIDAPDFLRRAQDLLAEFADDLKLHDHRASPTPDQRDAVHSLEQAAEELEAPLPRLEHALHPFVAFFIMPVFALANAGVAIRVAEGGGVAELFTQPITLGIVAGLVLGKQVGVLLFAWLASAVGLAALPAGASWRQLWGVSLLCGIGFTMSLFIAGLAFADPGDLDAAKVGILAGSLVSGVAGALVLLKRGPVPAGGAEENGG